MKNTPVIARSGGRSPSMLLGMVRGMVSKIEPQSLLVLILCLTLLISGCATTGDYRLKVGDELRVVIWNKLDEKTIVRPDQKISLPLAGEISCKNKTPDELSKELSKKYEAETTVMVSKYHTFKDDLKEIVGFIRDAAIVYFIGERVANEKGR